MAAFLRAMRPGVLGALLLFTAAFGREINGARLWIELGPIRFQPAEPAKLATILVLARYLASRADGVGSLRDLVVPSAIAAAPLALVMLQPDLGTAQAFVGILFAALFWAGTPIPLLLLLAAWGECPGN